MNIKNKAILAPLSEYTTAPFRKLCKKYGADLVVVPLVSATAIARNPRYAEKIDYSPEFDDGIQLFGARPADFKIALDVLLQKFPSLKWVDLNCGCPSYRVCEPGAGSALLKSPDTVADIIMQMRAGIKVLSIKMRLAGAHEETIAFARAIAEEGIDFITVHGRTPKQGYSGKADWEEIRCVKDAVDVPLVGNGDLTCRKDGEEKIKDGYCDAFMIGRAAMGNPKCFSNLMAREKGDCLDTIREYIEVCNQLGTCNVNDIRQKALQIIRGFGGAADIREKISHCKSIEQINDILKLE
ncbi:MAG: tRNA-dihydrouridine synthase family protein [Candidatus Micrarchaeia archaeon]